MGFLKVLCHLKYSEVYMRSLHTIKTKWFINITFSFATEKMAVKKWKQQQNFLNAFEISFWIRVSTF